MYEFENGKGEGNEARMARGNDREGRKGDRKRLRDDRVTTRM